VIKKIKTPLKGLYIFQGKKFSDNRGFLREVFHKKQIKKNLIFSIVTKSKKNTLRGLHLQKRKTQDKFITVIKGEILDVVVDLRKNSSTFGKHFKIFLSEQNCKFLFIPKGFAHGFLAKKKENIVLYSCSNYRYPKGERSIRYDDKDIKIKWGIKKPILSVKDKNALSLREYIKKNKL